MAPGCERAATRTAAQESPGSRAGPAGSGRAYCPGFVFSLARGLLHELGVDLDRGLVADDGPASTIAFHRLEAP